MSAEETSAMPATAGQTARLPKAPAKAPDNTGARVAPHPVTNMTKAFTLPRWEQGDREAMNTWEFVAETISPIVQITVEASTQAVDEQKYRRPNPAA